MTTLRFDASHRPSDATEPPKIARQAASSDPEPGRWGKPRMISIILPARNEAANLPTLLNEIASAFRPLLMDCSTDFPLDAYEIVVVDDGSTDNSSRILLDLQADHPELRPIRLRVNVGQSAATAAGFREARGEWVATLDADLQNRPEDLAALWKILPGHDAALGWRTKREDVCSKRVISRWANLFRNVTLGQAIKDTGCSVRIFRRETALRLPAFRGFHRFLGPLLLREGAKIVQAPVRHRPRTHGLSHYNIWNRSYQVLIDLLGVAWLMRRGLRYELASAATLDQPPCSRVPAPHSVQQQGNAHKTTSTASTGSRREAA